MSSLLNKLLPLLLATLPSSLSLPTAEYATELFQSSWQTFPTGWIIDTGTGYSGGPSNWGTNEVQTYTSDPSNISINPSGNLAITPQKSPSGAWTSARIETAADHDLVCPPTGKLWVEAKIKLGANPTAKSMGIWPAFWLLGSPYRGNYWNWPQIGELDILESANGYSEVWHTVHCGTNPGGPCDETNGIGSSGSMTRGAWHTLAVEVDASSANWSSQFVRFLVDGQERLRVTGSRVGSQTYWTPIVQNPKMILLNVAVGGGFPDGVGGTTTPTSSTIGGSGASMEIEYIAAYST